VVQFEKMTARPIQLCIIPPMIEHIGDFLQHHLVVLAAAVLVLVKLVILRLCRDSEGEAMALLSFPEDLCYVALGLILADLVSSEGAFRRHFRGTQHFGIDIAITIVLNVGVALLVHKLAWKGNEHFKTYRAAGSVRIRKPEFAGSQLELPITATDDNFQTIQVRGIALFSMLYAFQIILVMWWFSWISGIISNR
jgi:hypothetical protein